MSQYLGDISAYALAVSQGYTGTEEEYAELMASYATVGQTAVTAAQTATTKASEAATSATTATNKASEATTAATTATTKAGEAVANAEAAARDASQAMAAESVATSKASEATTAAATAVSAKDDAVSANTAAQSAKTAAQTAQTGAETAAASVEASAEQIATNAEDISQLKSGFTGRALLSITPEFEDGKFVASGGNTGNNSAFALSHFIKCEDVYRIYSGFAKNYCIAYYDDTYTFLSMQNVANVSFVAQWVTVSVPDGATYLRFNTFKNTVGISDTIVEYYNAPKLLDNKLAEIESVGLFRTVQYTVVATDGYINTSGNIVNVNNFKRTNTFMLYKGERVEIVAEGLQNYVSILSKYNGNTYDPIILTDANRVERYTYDVAETGLYACSYITNSGLKLQAYTPIGAITDELQSITESDEQIDANILAMYDNFICIGDSLTWSQVYTGATEQRRAYKTYPQILGSLCGGIGHCYATAGDTAVLWWSRSSAGAFDDHGIYIVFLGTNGGLTDTIDTDCVGSDPDQFDKTTNTGAYGAILQTIKNNGDKAVLVKPWAGGGSSLSVTNEVIDKFASKYDYPVISVPAYERDNEYYHKFPDGTGLNGLHFNDVGYAWLANAIKEQINLLSPADKFKIMRTQ